MHAPRPLARLAFGGWIALAAAGLAMPLALAAVVAMIAAPVRAADGAASASERSKALLNPGLAPGGRPYLPGVVIVKLAEGAPSGSPARKAATGSAQIDAVLERLGVQSVQRVARSARTLGMVRGGEISRIHIVRYAGGSDALLVAREIAALPGVEYAEPHFVHELALVPNDTNFNLQAAYLNRMQFPAAWDTTTGGMGNVVIAVCDGGTDWDHPDLLANIWSNPGEIPDNGQDDDGNDYIDDVRGWNFANDTNDPTGLPQTPDSGRHGTHTAGIAGAVANNAAGVAGASFNAKIMPICAADPTRDNGIAYGYEGIVYAAENGADVVNCSWGGQGSPSSFEQDVIDFAWANGTVVVAAAGNNSSTLEFYPAAYAHVTAVANVTNTDVRYTNTNYGTWVDVSAQGMNIYSTWPGGAYAYLTGTSMAAPHVSAACGLVKTRWPGYTADQVAERVRVTSDNIDGLNSSAYRGNLGYGRINARSALTKNTPAVRIATNSWTETDGDGVVEPGETITFEISVTNFLASWTGFTFTLRDNSNYVTQVDSVATLAALDSLQTLPLATLSMSVSPSVPIQHTVRFTLYMTTDTEPAYVDRDRFEITIQPVFGTHDANRVDCTVTSVGKLGYAIRAGGNGRDGIGFRYDGSSSYLYEGSLLVGTGVTRISDAARTSGSLQDDDFVTFPGGTPDVRGPLPAIGQFDERGFAKFTDAAATTPLNIEITQESWEFTEPDDDDTIVLKYRIKNNGLVDLTPLYAGWFCDWDIDASSYASNATGYLDSLGMIYAYALPGGPGDYLGILTLTDPGTTSARGIDNAATGPSPNWGTYDSYSDQEKWETLQGGIVHTVVDNADVAVGIATGPFTIAAGDSQIVAFAFVAGPDLASLEANGWAAKRKWEAGLPTDAPGDPPASGPKPLHLAQNAPNPFNPATTIAFDLPRAARVQLRVYDAAGRLVRTLIDGVQPAGAHRAHWNGRDDAGRRMPSGTYFYRFSVEGGRTLTRKMQLVK